MNPRSDEDGVYWSVRCESWTTEMAFVAGLEAHLRMISTEAKCKYSIVKDAAERAMFKVR